MTQGTSDRRERREIGGGATGAIYFVVAVFSVVWIGAVIAYVRGYFGIGADAGMNPANWGLAPHVLASLAILGILPPLFVWLAALSLHRAATLTRIATELTHATRRLSAPMDFAREDADTAAAGFERRIQAMATALDGLDRTMKDIEERLAEQISAVQSAGRQIGTEAQQIEKHLAAEREALRDVAHLLGNEANQVARMFGSASEGGGRHAPAGGADADALAEIGAALTGARQDGDAREADEAVPAATARGEDGRPLTPLEELTAYLAHHRSTQDAAKALALMKKAASENSDAGPEGREGARPSRYPLASDLLDMSDTEEARAGDGIEDAAREQSQHALHLGVPDEEAGPGPQDEDAVDGDTGPGAADEESQEAGLDLDLEESEAGELAELEVFDEEQEEPQAAEPEPEAAAPTREAALAVAATDDGEHAELDESALEDLPSSLLLDLPKALKTQLEGLHALTIDLNRLLGTNPPVANWRRYMNGERDVFTLHLIRWAADRQENLATAYGASEEFRKYADRYLTNYGKLTEALDAADGLEAQRGALPATDVTLIADLLIAARDARATEAESEETEAGETS
ncbi:hypothetical protein [Futiania mangrovi]|uniref:Uncharacterized protein n=1 Tax=Futiania mangrovi TaxID=2959716 RepID=A0A9J6P7R8_9PROT|nr:hypothetical protein [Futiania mangrovii]MCP1335020.1 hypothetical protein [Futiania mangrovii]